MSSDQCEFGSICQYAHGESELCRSHSPDWPAPSSVHLDQQTDPTTTDTEVYFSKSLNLNSVLKLIKFLTPLQP